MSRFEYGTVLVAFAVVVVVVVVVVVRSVLFVGSRVAARVESHRHPATWAVLFLAIVTYFELASASVLRADRAQAGGSSARPPRRGANPVARPGSGRGTA